jgi:hypothetical protein
MGDAVLMGAVPMEDMDLVLNPRLQQVTVNPAKPEYPDGSRQIGLPTDQTPERIDSAQAAPPKNPIATTETQHWSTQCTGSSPS